MNNFTRYLKRLLLAAGCEFRRHGRGDHEVWWSPISRRAFTVDGAVTSRHTANETLKEAPKAF